MYISHDLYTRLKRSIFAVNKMKGVSSAGALELVKQTIVRDAGDEGSVKLMAGHGGTLDHTATGVLVVGLFWGCKLLSSLLKGDKLYEFSAKLGQATTTFNELGDITAESDYSHVTKERLTAACETFVGDVVQTAPVYSALKLGGKRLSDLARAGLPVEPKTRTVKCHGVIVKDVSLPYFTAQVTCGGGFYVRSLVHDIGRELGTHAHVVCLKRLAQSPFRLDDCISLEDLTLEKIIIASRRTQQQYGALLKNLKKPRKNQTEGG